MCHKHLPHLAIYFFNIGIYRFALFVLFEKSTYISYMITLWSITIYIMTRLTDLLSYPPCYGGIIGIVTFLNV